MNSQWRIYKPIFWEWPLGGGGGRGQNSEIIILHQYIIDMFKIRGLQIFFFLGGGGGPTTPSINMPPVNRYKICTHIVKRRAHVHFHIIFQERQKT